MERTLPLGTRSARPVSPKATCTSSRLAPEISSTAIRSTRPTPCAGCVTRSPTSKTSPATSAVHSRGPAPPKCMAAIEPDFPTFLPRQIPTRGTCRSMHLI